jgi:hypothetical protein
MAKKRAASLAETFSVNDVMGGSDFGEVVGSAWDTVFTLTDIVAMVGWIRP